MYNLNYTEGSNPSYSFDQTVSLVRVAFNQTIHYINGNLSLCRLVEIRRFFLDNKKIISVNLKVSFLSKHENKNFGKRIFNLFSILLYNSKDLLPWLFYRFLRIAFRVIRRGGKISNFF